MSNIETNLTPSQDMAASASLGHPHSSYQQGEVFLAEMNARLACAESAKPLGQTMMSGIPTGINNNRGL